MASTDIAAPLKLSLRGVAAALRKREISPVELTRLALAQIEADEPRLNAYVRLTADQALAAAHQAEREMAAGMDRGELHGVPVAVKDLYDMAGLPTTACDSRSTQAELTLAKWSWRTCELQVVGRPAMS